MMAVQLASSGKVSCPNRTGNLSPGGSKGSATAWGWTSETLTYGTDLTFQEVETIRIGIFGQTTKFLGKQWDVIVPCGTSVCAKTRMRSPSPFFDSGLLLC